MPYSPNFDFFALNIDNTLRIMARNSSLEANILSYKAHPGQIMKGHFFIVCNNLTPTGIQYETDYTQNA